MYKNEQADILGEPQAAPKSLGNQVGLVQPVRFFWIHRNLLNDLFWKKHRLFGGQYTLVLTCGLPPPSFCPDHSHEWVLKLHHCLRGLLTAMPNSRLEIRRVDGQAHCAKSARLSLHLYLHVALPGESLHSCGLQLHPRELEKTGPVSEACEAQVGLFVRNYSSWYRILMLLKPLLPTPESCENVPGSVLLPRLALAYNRPLLLVLSALRGLDSCSCVFWRDLHKLVLNS